MTGSKMIAVFVLILASSLVVHAETKEQKQAKIRKKSTETLERLYKARPSAKAAVEAAAGYAVFTSRSVKILIGGTGRGQGLAVENGTQKITYMKMGEIQAGLGMGVKKFSVVFVFETKEALHKFINSGWEFGGQATAAAKSRDGGGAYQGATSVSPGVWMYQLTDKGLALELTAKGTKYSRDDKLN